MLSCGLVLSGAEKGFTTIHHAVEFPSARYRLVSRTVYHNGSLPQVLDMLLFLLGSSG
jgi:hypothetical protein